MSSGISATRVAVKLASAMIVMAAALFGSAGTLRWPEAWGYLILQCAFSTALATWLKRHNPELLKERMTFLKPSARPWDKAIVLIATVVFIPYLILPGLDAVRYHWSHVSWPFQAIGFAGIAASFSSIAWVMRENPYLSRVVEIQEDKGHRVVTTGPYQYVRHPMYVGVIVSFFSIPLALGSLWTFIPAAVLTALIVVRTHLEDKTLHAELAGYETYAEKVRCRLVPGIW